MLTYIIESRGLDDHNNSTNSTRLARQIRFVITTNVRVFIIRMYISNFFFFNEFALSIRREIRLVNTFTNKSSFYSYKREMHIKHKLNQNDLLKSDCICTQRIFAQFVLQAHYTVLLTFIAVIIV